MSTGRRSFSSAIHFAPFRPDNGGDQTLWTVGATEDPVVVDQVLIGTNDPVGTIAFTLDSFSDNGFMWGTTWEDITTQHFVIPGPIYILPGHNFRVRLVGTALGTSVYLAMRSLWFEG